LVGKRLLSWALQLKVLGVCIAIPTLDLAIVIVIKTRKNLSVLLPNIAIAIWITATSIWMCDEFFELDIKEICYVPFGIGLIIIFYWLIYYIPSIWMEYNDDL